MRSLHTNVPALFLRSSGIFSRREGHDVTIFDTSDGDVTLRFDTVSAPQLLSPSHEAGIRILFYMG